MIRFVVGPGQVIVPDLAGRLPGRGIWLSAGRDVLETARRKGAFARAARGSVNVPPDIVAIVETGLERRVTELIGFARRAGQAVAGFTKAREWIAAGRCGVLVEARDGSPDERRRLVGRVGARTGEGGRDEVRAGAFGADARGEGVAGAERSGVIGGRAGEVTGEVAGMLTVVSPLSAAILGSVFGRDHIVHVAIAPGRLAGSIVAEATRLSGFVGTRRADAGSVSGSSDRQVHER